MGNVGRPQGREGWGENGVDDRAVVSILPANLNPPLFPPTSRKALERSSFTAAGRVRLKAKGRFVQALALFTFSGGGGGVVTRLCKPLGVEFIYFSPRTHILNARFQTSPPPHAPSFFASRELSTPPSLS